MKFQLGFKKKRALKKKLFDELLLLSFFIRSSKIFSFFESSLILLDLFLVKNCESLKAPLIRQNISKAFYFIF
jgi:hypothetical protein